ncbi:hypothetical protein UlMin_046017 [Ulmus minor]
MTATTKSASLEKIHKYENHNLDQDPQCTLRMPRAPHTSHALSCLGPHPARILLPIQKDCPNEDWLHLTALIHDLGKVFALLVFGKLPQWAIVGDTFHVGCAFDESIVHHKYFKENPDYNNPTFNTKYGVYFEGCGLENVMMSFGHDDYMYLENKTTLPSAGLFIIRYHSFYHKICFALVISLKKCHFTNKISIKKC